jgi:excisionase family DNA binding protein
MAFLTTNDAAEKLGVSRRRVIALITSGRLPAQKIGRDYLIQEQDLGFVADRRPGRPKGSGPKASLKGKKPKTKP